MRRIKKAFIKHISLVPRGANQLPVIYKSDDETAEFNTIVKADMEEGTITSIVYSPERRDSQGDIASAEVIKDMAYEFARSGEGVDLRHNNKAFQKSDVFVAESFIVQKDDPRFRDVKDYSGAPVDTEGSWAVVIKVENEDLRAAYRNGEWSGVSMGGTAQVEAEKEEVFGDTLEDLLGNVLKGEFNVDKQEIADLLKANNESLIETLKEALAPAPVEKEQEVAGKPDVPAAPLFKGDMTSEEDRKAHRKALALWKAEQDFAGDPVALFDAKEKIEDEYIGKEDARKAPSNQPVAKDGDTSYDVDGISKEDRDLMAEAVKSIRGGNG